MEESACNTLVYCIRPETQKDSSRSGLCRLLLFPMILLLITSSYLSVFAFRVTLSFLFFSTIIANVMSGLVQTECSPWPRVFHVIAALARIIATLIVNDIRLFLLHTLMILYIFLSGKSICRILREERMPPLSMDTPIIRLQLNGNPFQSMEIPPSHLHSNLCFMMTEVLNLFTKR